MSDVCHRCCVRPATRECTERQSTWSRVCESCFDKMGDEQYLYVPPDGRTLPVAPTRVSATREAYIRGCASTETHDCHIGLEWRAGDDVPALAERVRELAFEALLGHVDRGHAHIVRHAEYYIQQRWPDRAYFVETDDDGRGVQVYQPFGMPRNA